MIEVENISLGQMPNGAHYEFHSTAYQRGRENEVINEKAAPELTAYDVALGNENNCLKLPQKSQLTAEIESAVKKRAECYMGYITVVRGMRNIPDEARAEAANTLWEHIASYDINPHGQMDKTTGMVTNFVEDLETKYQSEVEALSLEAYVTCIKEANEEVSAKLMLRDNEWSTRIVGGTILYRKETDNCYNAFIAKINALILIEGISAYETFVREMNAQITRFKQEVLSQRKKRKKPELPDTPPSNSEDTTEPDIPTEPEEDEPVVQAARG